MKKLILASLITCVSLCAYGQVPVSILTGGQFTSFLPSGAPNAFGCVFTYASNTTTQLASYTDTTGITQNQNPVPLSAGGVANIWLQTSSLYTIVVKTSGGINCSSGSTVYSENGINGSLLLSNNSWVGTQIFSQPIQILAPDLQIVFGNSSGTQTTLDIPPTSSNLILHSPPITANDTLLSQNATQTVQNKNLTAGTQINGCGVINGPATYVCIANNGSTATILNSLAILTGAPATATVAPTSATDGIVGIVTANAGITGNTTIQQSGTLHCNFDGATTAGDYVIASTTVAGDCHDTGSAPPNYPSLSTAVQLLGLVLSTNSGSGSYQMSYASQIIGSSIGGVPTTTAGAGAGTLPTITLLNGSRDHAGEIQVLTGSSPSISSVVVTVNFAQPYANAGFCVISPYNANAASVAVSLEVTSGATLVGFAIGVNGGSALSAATTYSWNYSCQGY